MACAADRLTLFKNVVNMRKKKRMKKRTSLDPQDTGSSHLPSASETRPSKSSAEEVANTPSPGQPMARKQKDRGTARRAATRQNLAVSTPP